MTKTEFIEKIATYVKKYAPAYGIRVHSPIIAQAILESGWGESKLASQYHNYFGLKCGTKWTGKSVNMTTQEEYTVGTLTAIKDDFRVYDSMEEGVKGYFEFIKLERYSNLKGITDPKQYLETIKVDGYATSSAYVTNTYKLITQYELTKYDTTKKEVGKTMGKYASTLIAQAKTWIGCNEADGSHKKIIDVYNSHKPLARGYAVKYTDAWCATFVSACAIATGMTNIVPTECACEPYVNLLKAKGVWIEDESITPKPGYIILYDWDDNGVGDNKGYTDHIGIVEKVSNGNVTIIEGNYSNSVKRRTLSVNARYIRGYGAPKYDAEPSGSTTPVTPAPKPTTSGAPSKTPKWVGKVTADALNVRTWASKENPNIKSYPVLYRGNLVDVCDSVKDSKGAAWYYVRIAGKIYGFVHSDYITKA